MMLRESQSGVVNYDLPPSELERIDQFRETLGRIEVKPLTTQIDINEVYPAAVAKRDFFNNNYQPGPCFYALPEIAHELAEDLTGFEPYVSRGGKASAHGVFFGALTFADGFELPVAVKPHSVNEDSVYSRREAEESCLRDYFTNSAATKSGFESLEPVGFILDDGGNSYSLTVLDEKLTSLESNEWREFFRKGFVNTGMREQLYKVALNAASLHDTGYSYHGDLAPRNIATNLYGQVFFIDWEKGNLTKAEAPDIEERFGKSWIDLKTLMQGMVKPPYGNDPGIGMFKYCEGDWWNCFKDVVLDDYLETRRMLASQGSHHMIRLKATESELVQLEHALHLEMDKLQQAIRK